MIVGWELVKASPASVQPELYYWENLSRGSSAEVDFVITRAMQILPIEVKSGTSGKMKSLRLFLERKELREGIRTSLENFGTLTYESPLDTETHISIIPIYAIGRLMQKD